MMYLKQINIFMSTSLQSSGSKEIYCYCVSKYVNNVFNIYFCVREDTGAPTCCTQWATLKTYHKFLQKLGEDKSSHEFFKDDSNLFILTMRNNDVELKYIKIDGKEYALSSLNVFILTYDYNAFLKSEDTLVNKCENVDIENINQFEILNAIVKHNSGTCLETSLIKEGAQLGSSGKVKYLSRMCWLLSLLCSYSNLCIQIECFCKSLYWLICNIWREKKVSVKAGNLLTSLLINFFGGLFILYWIDQLSSTPINDLYYMIELIVNNLQSLLQWLMGSPAGLKLNHAFNTMLGKFFLYHIGLWWMFLVIIKSFLETGLNILKIVGLFGITFQTAILADLLSLSSFHVYCIYTYAARLYNIQISGLVALWRLFLGRKHNPLRGGVDSCEYNHHQLFVGTLAFTILLFLLPTTFLYYVVFTSFRVSLVLLGGFLTRLRYFVQSLPLYLIGLWILKSSKVAGDIKVTVDSERAGLKDNVYLKITLQIAPLHQLILKYHPPPIAKPHFIKWAQLLKSLCRGHLLYPV